MSYEMNKDPPGLCLIVNNVNFQNKELNRPGAVKDESSVKLLFRTLYFKMIICRDLTNQKLEKVAQNFGAENHKAFKAFVFIVMSHRGDRDCILGVDERLSCLHPPTEAFATAPCFVSCRHPDHGTWFIQVRNCKNWSNMLCSIRVLTA